MIATAIVFVGITLIGGFWAAGLTNVINVAVIYLGIGLGVVLTMGKVGGLGSLTAALPAAHPGFDLLGVGFGQIAAWFLVMITTVVLDAVGRPDSLRRPRRAQRDERVSAGRAADPAGRLPQRAHRHGGRGAASGHRPGRGAAREPCSTCRRSSRASCCPGCGRPTSARPRRCSSAARRSSRATSSSASSRRTCRPRASS